tara:strand:+ start:1 stop:1002 length:1002 start_codon:yes stop_codon:yes gene_type:complete
MENTFYGYEKKIGILITNLGTPDSTSTRDLRKYLDEFLSDYRVVDWPRILWLLILKGIILNVRPKKSAEAYKEIWTENGSPLMVYSKNITKKLKQRIESNNKNIEIKLAMRYGNPSIKKAMNEFKEKNISKILVFPLYPQSGSPTTASTFDGVANYLKKQIWMPNIRFISGYHDNKLYIKSIADSIENSFRKNGKPEKLIFSYHGMPQRYLKNGDPYFCFCHKTTRLVVEKLNLKSSDYLMAFQSRFGPEKWLQPYLDEKIVEYAKDGIKSIHIISPGFSVDCLETLEEINMQYRDLFIENGGENFKYIKCLNEQDSHIDMIQKIVMDNIEKW